jgi:hypothetical protein
MKILSINTHLTYPGWSEGKLNLTFMNLAKAFFVERGYPVAETFVERGYDPEEEVKKHAAADLVILQTPVNWFSAPWIYKKYVDEVFNVGPSRGCDRGRTFRWPGRTAGRSSSLNRIVRPFNLRSPLTAPTGGGGQFRRSGGEPHRQRAVSFRLLIAPRRCELGSSLASAFRR